MPHLDLQPGQRVLDRCCGLGTKTMQIVDVLKAAVQGRISIIITGGTGSGKTTLLNALSNYIPASASATLEIRRI